MQSDHENGRSTQRDRNIEHSSARGFRPLALPAVVAAAKAMARRTELRDAETERRERRERGEA